MSLRCHLNLYNLHSILYSIAGRFLTVVKKSVDRGVRHLEPVIKERYRMMEQLGPEYEGKPVSLIFHA